MRVRFPRGMDANDFILGEAAGRIAETLRAVGRVDGNLQPQSVERETRRRGAGHAHCAAGTDPRSSAGRGRYSRGVSVDSGSCAARFFRPP